MGLILHGLGSRKPNLSNLEAMWGAKLAGRNLLGLSFSNLSASVIAQTVNLRGLKLTGTGVTRVALQNAPNAQVPPKTGFFFDLDSVTF